MQIIILAGGKGKRLGEKYKDIPGVHYVTIEVTKDKVMR